MRWAIGALGALLCASGATVFLLAHQARGGFGWTAYAPLGPAVPGVFPDAYRSELTMTFTDRWTVFWTGGHLAGALLVVLGLLVLAALAGWLVGRRSAVGATG